MRDKISLSKRVKDSIKMAVKHISNFEQTAAEIAIDRGYQYVVCGHIHEPITKTYYNPKGSVEYLNSGDWIENLTALEYQDKSWKLVYYRDLIISEDQIPETDSEDKAVDVNQFYAQFMSQAAHAARL
jgi:UDP-2,3-diacylglucosamine pyrophosphatase LpxH